MTTTNSRISRQDARPWMIVTGLAGIIIGLLLAPLAALAQTPPVGQSTDRPPEHTLSVTGTGTITVAPDLADVTLGVQVQRANLTAAHDEAARLMSDVVAALRALGIADADIQTSIFNVSPVIDYSGMTQRITGYSVLNLVMIHVRDLDKLAAVIDDSVAAGASTVQGVTFRVDDPSAIENQAREAAVRDARSRADTLAAAAGVQITGVASISESYNAPWPMWGPDFSRDEASGTPIMPGTTEVTITVSISYLLP